MGLLDYSTITTYDYNKSKDFQWKVKKNAIEQFLRLYTKFSDFKPDDGKYRKYGYELEFNTVKIEKSEDGKLQYGLQTDLEFLKGQEASNFDIHAEYGAWMAELVPKIPMSQYLGSKQLKDDIELLYSSAMKFTETTPNRLLSLPFYPKFGSIYMVNDLELGGYSLQEISEKNTISRSEYMDDCIISKHPRFSTFTQNVRQRRKEKPQIIAPLFKDEETNMTEILPNEKKAGEIHLDCFAFGMGLCCLQVTVGCDSIDESRWLYDQYHMFTPIFVILFLTPACSKCLNAHC